MPRKRKEPVLSFAERKKALDADIDAEIERWSLELDKLRTTAAAVEEELAHLMTLRYGPAPIRKEEPALALPVSAGGEAGEVSGATPADPPHDPLEPPACCDRRGEVARV